MTTRRIVERLEQNNKEDSCIHWIGLFEDAEMQLLERAMKKNRVVRSMSFSKLRLTEESGNAALARMLSSSLEELVIEYEIGGNWNMAGIVFRALSRSFIKALSIRMYVGSLDGVSELCRAIKVTRTLERLVLTSVSRANFRGTDMTRFTNALACNVSLVELTLGDIYLANQDAKELAAALSVNRHLVILSLWHNGLRDQGVVDLVRGIQRNKHLQQIAIKSNNIGSEGAKAIAQLIRHKNSQITSLFLEHNEIGNEGAFAIAEALLSCSRLKEINLWFNYIGNQGAVALANALERNTMLEQLCLGNNAVDHSLNAQIQYYLTKLHRHMNNHATLWPLQLWPFVLSKVNETVKDGGNLHVIWYYLQSQPSLYSMASIKKKSTSSSAPFE